MNVPNQKQLPPFPELSPEQEPLSEWRLLSVLSALDAANVAGISAQEHALLSAAGSPDVSSAKQVRRAIQLGFDPLGDYFSQLRSPGDRRPLGATYTPLPIVDAMVNWAATHAVPDRVVDPGVGSARFLVRAGAAFPDAALVGFEIDPLAALIARANLSALGYSHRSTVFLQDYRGAAAAPIAGRTLFIGNPPYVRHHLIGAQWKEWLTNNAKRLGHGASQLAGLHVHFFVATLLHAQEGDYGALITAAEWLDVNYGRLLRELFLGKLGGEGIVMVEPTARPFPDAATTASITTFEIGHRPPSVRLARVDNVASLPTALQRGVRIRRERLAAETRWTQFFRASRPIPDGFIELGEICRVHRGAVTGANKVWIEGPQSIALPPHVLYRSVTKARELFTSGGVLRDGTRLRRVIDLPADLDVLDTTDRKAVEAFLVWARSMGADKGYIATHRRAWWSVGLRPPPPIMATYMARRPPAFALNAANARFINIAHGLYPREPLTPEQVEMLTKYLARAATQAQGRTYAGGLMKFEPREMERILVPASAVLAQTLQ